MTGTAFSKKDSVLFSVMRMLSLVCWLWWFVNGLGWFAATMRPDKGWLLPGWLYLSFPVVMYIQYKCCMCCERLLARYDCPVARYRGKLLIGGPRE